MTSEETPISFTAYTPILEGYTFEGWTPSELTAGTTGDVVITAAWAIDTFDVVFYKNPTEVNEIQRVTYSGSPVAVSQIDSVDYEFSGWYTTPELEQLVSLQAFKVYSDTALYAKWISTSVSTYKVYFKSFEVIVDSQRVEEGQTASAITLSAVPGYVFEGWNFDFTTPIFNDTTLTAQWTKQDTFTVATPIISPTADISYQDSVRVSISCDTAENYFHIANPHFIQQ